MVHKIGEDRLKDAEDDLLKAVYKLEFAGLLNNHVLHQPDLNKIIKETFAELRKIEVDAVDVAE